MRLRPMTMDDADFMLTLKNDPDTRRFAIKSKEEIKREDHIKWLSTHIMWFSVIETDYGVPVGALRIFGNEVSIWIDKAYRGLGLATAVLSRETTKGNYAQIVDGNVASMRAFIKAGFIPVQHSGLGLCNSNGDSLPSSYTLRK